MSYSAFGTKKALVGYSSVEVEFSVMPLLEEPSKAAVYEHVARSLGSVQQDALLADAVRAQADQRPMPVRQETLEELLAVCAVRLVQLRARAEVERNSTAVSHLTRLRNLVAP